MKNLIAMTAFVVVALYLKLFLVLVVYYAAYQEFKPLTKKYHVTWFIFNLLAISFMLLV